MIILYVLLGIIGCLLLLFLLYVIFLGICSLFVDPKKEYTHNSRFYRMLLYSATAGTLKLLRIKVHTTGIEKLPKGQRLLFVGNHRSNFDPIIQWQILRPWEVAFVSKEANFHIPFFGRFIRKCCFLAIDREDPRKAILTLHKASELIKSKEVSVGIYPEGTRSKSGELLPFHDGVFRIAQKADCPIAVMAVRGTEQIHKNVMRRKTDVYLDILEVIPAEEAKHLKTHVISADVRQLLSDELSKQEEQPVSENCLQA